MRANGSDEQRRAWREAFCYWVGETFLATLCSAVGGAIGLVLCAPAWYGLALPSACLAFVWSIPVAAVVRALLGKVRFHNLWMVSWAAFGALVAWVWTMLLFHF
jgi:formate hydrogenlyase subunit 4